MAEGRQEERVPPRTTSGSEVLCLIYVPKQIIKTTTALNHRRQREEIL
jgi:hypothetical protein